MINSCKRIGVFYLMIALLLLIGCQNDPVLRLNEGIIESDRIEMKMLVGESLVEAIKFAYSSEEEKTELIAGLGALEESESNCLAEMGRLVFFKEEKAGLELLFNAENGCAQAWFQDGMDGKVFMLSDSLTVLIQERFELVSSVKSQ